MRARFTSHLASHNVDYPEGRVVEVGGKTYAADRVPEAIGRAWLASGVLVPVDAPEVESAFIRPPETAARAAAQPRRAAVKD